MSESIGHGDEEQRHHDEVAVVPDIVEDEVYFVEFHLDIFKY